MIEADDILKHCDELGFARAGICAAEPSDHGNAYRDWIANGQHGEMTYLENYVAKRIDPGQLLEGAKSIICVADRYAISRRSVSQPDNETNMPRGRVAKYAQGHDYHKVIKKRLHQLCDALQAEYPKAVFKACVDTAPILEREHAQRAGLGSIGKHTLLIEKGVSSYHLLGAIVTTLELQPSQPSAADACGSCTRCIDACPTNAISPWKVDATKCISYLTIEHRSEIDAQLQTAMGDWIFGCDICQDVCPHNQPARRKQAAEVHEAYRPRNQTFGLLEILNWNEDDRRAAFERSPMKRAKLFMMKRNALIAAGNAIRESPNPPLLSAIQSAAMDDHPVVRKTASQILASLKRL